jgi:hypothetical protein
MFFVLSFLFFPPTKSENRRAEQVLTRGEGYQEWEGGFWGKRVGGEYSTIKCVHM